MSSNSSEQRYTHISADSWHVIKPLGYSENKSEDKDSDKDLDSRNIELFLSQSLLTHLPETLTHTVGN